MLFLKCRMSLWLRSSVEGYLIITSHASKDAKDIEYISQRALPLPVSVPSHCALMQPAAEQLAALLNEIEMNNPLLPVVNNVDVKVNFEVDDIRDALVRQLYRPVQWTKTVEWLSAQGITSVLEVGPGKVLTGLNKRIIKTLDCSSIHAPDHLNVG